MSQKELKKLLHYNRKTGVFTWKIGFRNWVNAGDVAGYLRSDGYAYIQICKKTYAAHRLAWFYVYGKFPKNEMDHINHIRNDNKICNLRVVSTLENSHNRTISKNNTSGVSGVHYYRAKKKWQAYIQIKKKAKYLGLFDSMEDAKQVREKAKIKYGFHPNHA